MAIRAALPDDRRVRVLFFTLALFAVGCGGNLPPLGNRDLAGSGDGGPSDMSLLPLGTPCMTNAQCESGICFVGTSQSFCTLHCTQATVAQDCPVPPTDGTCNRQGYCKFN
jgi:hypothetical protein